MVTIGGPHEWRGKTSATVVRPDGFRMVDMDVDVAEGECGHQVLFDLAITLSVVADAQVPEMGAVACAVARAAIDQIVAAVEAGRVRHRATRTGSLAELDPCRIAPGVLRRMPFENPQPRSTPSGHSCSWSNYDASTWVDLDFATALLDPASAARLTTVAGRPTRVYESADGIGATCALVVDIGTPNAEGSLEVATVLVFRQGPEDLMAETCRTAIDVAGAVWPVLPAG